MSEPSAQGLDYVFAQLAAMNAARNNSSPPALDDHHTHDARVTPATARSDTPASQQHHAMSTHPPRAAPTEQNASPATAATHPTEALRGPSASASDSENTLARSPSNSSDDSVSSQRPSTPRSRTAPSLQTMATHQPQLRSQPSFPQPSFPRAHLRSQSTSSALNAPQMTRAHSLPTAMHTIGQFTLSPSPMPLASPLRSPKRTRSPRALEARASTGTLQERYGPGIRPASIGSFEGAPSVCDISEDAELELTPRAASGASGLYSTTGSLSRRRRPASPLYNVSVPFGGPLMGAPIVGAPIVGTPTSTASSSPLLAPSKFNEHYPWSLASSSVPSTPTSMRSRSPSISSLETIEDSPDAEEQAIEADRIAQLKAAADQEDGGEHRRSSLDVPEGRGRGFGFGKRDSRKRWSVCGGERRVDLSLDTVWED